MTDDLDFKAYVETRRALVDAALDRVLPPESAEPLSIHRAMRYSVLAPGKRLRPILVIAGAEAVGGRADDVLDTACALELIHAYSLIHDDLPAMDDDDYRRGRLTNHKVFGEAIAILAGDALLTLAFRLVAGNAARTASPAVVGGVVVEVADAAGTAGMVGGQVVDIESEGKIIAPETLDHIHLRKTASLIRAALRVGALLAGGRAEAVDAISRAGEALGLAFQIVDDILDVEGSLAELGKTAGSDERKHKATYPSLHGLPASKARARELIEETKRLLIPLGPAAAPIRALADYVLERRS
ncbi:MAG TPA: farnesyl diphosphate synthase [Methylomirabilota bacterium]|nr:farnesyl diphosphate synthase [Methylomirabilota bacterium]